MEVSALPLNLEMRLGCATSSLASSMTVLLAACYRALLASQGFLRGTIETRIVYSVAFAISEEGFQTDIEPYIRMRTFRWSMLGM